MKEFPLPYKLIIILILTAGFFGLINSWVLKYRQNIEESDILVEFKDTVVFDSTRELDIIFLTE